VLRPFDRKQLKDVSRGFGHAREHVHCLRRKITLLGGAFAPPHAPARIQDRLSRAVLLQDDEVAFQERQKARTFSWGFVVLQSYHELGAFLQTFQKVDHQVTDVFSVGTLEGEFFAPNCTQAEGLGEDLVGFLTRDGGHLGEGQLEEDLFLVVNHVDSGPVDRDDYVILGQVGTRVSVRLVKPRKQQRPLEFGVADNVFFHSQDGDLFLDVITLFVGLHHERRPPVDRLLHPRETIIWNVVRQKSQQSLHVHVRVIFDIILLRRYHS
jgi:hypothetical protein